MPHRPRAPRSVACLLAAALLVACTGPSNPAPTAFTARFDPVAGVLPSADDLLFRGSPDRTLTPPGAHPSDLGDPLAAWGTLDGFSTTAPIRATFSAPPDATSLAAGSTVRLFEVTLDGHAGSVASIDREASAGEFLARLDASDPAGRSVAIVPLVPLLEGASYLAVLTTGILDAVGAQVTADRAYAVTRSLDPLCENGQSLRPGFGDAEACALEALRARTAAQEGALAGVGIDPDDVALAWTFTTQSLTATLVAVRDAASAGAPASLFPSGLNTGALGMAPIADVIVGALDLPYYLLMPEAIAPVAGAGGEPLPGPLGGSWRAPPCGTVPACALALGVGNPSTNLKASNPMPVQNALVRVPLLATVPNNQPMPANGWPVVVFVHDLGRSRLDVLPMATTFAQLGYATLAIDLPLHGITPWDYAPALGGPSPFAAQFYAPAGVNPVLFPGMRERTFDVDYADDAGVAGADGTIDRSGQHMLGAASLLTLRDNLRQAAADVFALHASLPSFVIAGTGQRFDASKVAYVGVGLGATVVAVVAALEPNASRIVLSAPAVGLAASIDASPTLGPAFRASAAAAHGVEPGTPAHARFLDIAQNVLDAADPIAIGDAAAPLGSARVLLQVVVGGGALAGGGVGQPDHVFPPTVPGAPLAGSEALAAALALAPLAASVPPSATPVRRIARFGVGEHASLLDPARTDLHPPADPSGFAAVTTEMQGQVASFVFSAGAAVQVNAPGLLAAP